ncbi:hypothetical protein [Microbacterium sp. MMO-10]|uniref:hypothetical protein n=1 Tax=Microbacterium sp. MMO-10 TaxID=3081272 RepID=UPI003018FB14
MYVIEARTGEREWNQVQTVGEDLVDSTAETLIDLTEEGDSTQWRMRPADPDVKHPQPTRAPAVMPRPSRWERIRWWALLRFSKRARR